MGLDISISTDNPKNIHTSDYFDEKNGYYKKHSLSREFCNLMCRRNVVKHEPELDQIGKITGVDISSLYEMESYPDEEALTCDLDFAESEEEKQKILTEAETRKSLLIGNIDKVLQTATTLIESLQNIEKLDERLVQTDFDTLNPAYYFSDFKLDKGEGYIRNNFGQDLRNFKRFLEYAKSRGVKTVWFSYG